MSETWRERLKRVGRGAVECNEEEWKFIWSHIGDFCRASDEKIQKYAGKSVDVDSVCDDMSDGDFKAMSKEIIDETLKEFGKRGGSKKKKKTQLDEELELVAIKQGQEMMAEQETKNAETRLQC